MKKRYVLITPAYNEGEFIKDTIESVVTQTILPLKWIIVDDGSTDATSKIIKEYEKLSVAPILPQTLVCTDFHPV